MDELTLGSLFDGSGGFPLGGMLAGIRPVWSAEVEPFAIRVTTKRMPFVKHYGDVSTLNGGEMEPVDIITFGSPCQDMSVAGKRAGLGGSQSCLFYEAIRIVNEMRCATNGKYPTFIVWENVPGAFSSNGGEDFRAVLEAVCSVKWPGVSLPRPERWTTAGEILADGFSLAWRTLDAQYWGVPQRRKRIYLVADFADRRAGKILFESEGLSGYSAESFRAWQRAAGGAAAGTGAAGGDDYLAFHINQREETIDLHGVSGALMATQNTQMQTFIASPISGVVQSAGFCTEHSAKSRSIGYEEERSPTLRTGTVPATVALYENHAQDSRYTGPLDTSPTVSATYGTGGNNQPFVVGDTPKTLKIRCGCAGGGKGALIQEDKSATLGCSNDQTVFVPQAYGISAHLSKAMLSGNPHSGIYEADTSRTLDAKCGLPSCNQGGIAVVERSDEDTVNALTTGAFLQTAEDQAPTLLARDYKDPTAVAYGIGRDAFNQGQNAQFTPSVSEELQPPLVAKGPGAVKCGYTVRRLTPIECARLQGFPDWWCDGLGTENPTDEELTFWAEVWETHRRVVSHASKPKTERQIRKWLLNPYTDSAAYRLWGNGVALPCVYFVLAGIVYYAQFPL
ncbi:MAG: DNA cytosine methyltransferase [Clostridiales bacterium]|nr:DNA cytosine methyltransferase [Clostridiales bacterium]